MSEPVPSRPRCWTCAETSTPWARRSIRCTTSGPRGWSKTPKIGGGQPARRCARRSPKSRTEPERVLGLAVSCQAPTLLPLDRSGRPLRPAMIWMDRRAEAETVRLAEQMGADEIYRITGNRPDAFYVAARLLWLRNHEPEVLKQTWQFAQVNGYINYRLTGRLTLDPAHAVLLQMRDYAQGRMVRGSLLRLRSGAVAVPRGRGRRTAFRAKSPRRPRRLPASERALR